MVVVWIRFKAIKKTLITLTDPKPLSGSVYRLDMHEHKHSKHMLFWGHSVSTYPEFRQRFDQVTWWSIEYFLCYCVCECAWFCVCLFECVVVFCADDWVSLHYGGWEHLVFSRVRGRPHLHLSVLRVRWRPVGFIWVGAHDWNYRGSVVFQWPFPCRSVR